MMSFSFFIDKGQLNMFMHYLGIKMHMNSVWCRFLVI